MKRMYLFNIILVLFVVLAVTVWNPASAQQVGRSPESPTLTILFVKPGGSGGCTSWGDACELQAALTAAPTGTEIWVQEGIYKPTTGADRTLSFALKNGVALYGGFAGTETNRNQRDWEDNITTLSGDIGTEGDLSDNSYHVVTGHTVDGTAILDGFTITSGNANGLVYDEFGGGMYCDTGNPTINNVIFSGNSAVYGGGLLNHTAHPVLSDVTFSTNNATQNGGGLYNYLSNPTLTDVTFTNNTAVLNGGGISNTGSSPVLTRVDFTNNTAVYGGGLYNYESSPTLSHLTFTENSASGDGGGMHNTAGNVVMNNVTFSENDAGQYGGGMYNNASSPTLTEVTFTNNVAAARGGGIYNYSGSNPTLFAIIFSGNSATDYGGGIFNYTSHPSLVNAIFVGNLAGQMGGGMFNYMDDPTLINVTFAANSAVSGGGIYNNDSSPIIANVILWGNLPNQVINDLTSIPVISYSDIQGGCPSGATCTQVINSDPQFIRTPSPGGDSTWGTADDDYGDLHLPITSPAIDAGDNTAIPVSVTTDLDDGPRYVDILSVPDTGNGTAPIVDMGPYETYAETIAPTVVSILRADPSPTTASSVDYTVTFSEAVIGVSASDFSLTLSGVTGATVTGVTGGPTIYNVAVSTGTGSGTLRLDIPITASITDLVGNPLSGLPYTGGEVFTIDKTAPTVVSILRASPNPTNAASVNYSVTFSEAVTGVATGDFMLTLSGITSATVSGVTGGPTTYTVSVATGSGSGTLRLDIPVSASITDTVGNALTGLPYTTGESYTVDKTAPAVVSILRASPNPTNAASVNYTVTFSEAVTGVGVSDFSLTLSGITGATVSGVSGGPTVYTVAVATGSGAGTLRLDIPGSASITDTAGNALSGLPYTSGDSYTIDKTAPTVVSILRASPNPTMAASVNFTVTFSEAVTGVEVTDFTLTLSGVTGATVSGVSGGSTTYTVSVATGSGSGTLRLDIPVSASITDTLGNALTGLPYTSGESYTVDRTAPAVVSILRASPNPTNAPSVNYTVTFSEAVTGVEVTDFTLTLSGVTGATVSGVSGGPTTYTVGVATGSGSGTLRLDVPNTASISDAVGNALSGLPFTSGESYTMDKTAPTVVSILRASPDPTNTASVSYTVTFSEAVTDIGISDFSLTLSGITGATVSGVSGGPTTYTVSVATGSGSGTLRLDIPDTASALDAAGNALSGLPYTTGESYTIDKTAPTVVSILRADPDPTNADEVDYTVTFSEAVTGVGTSDFTLSISGLLDTGIMAISGGPTTYTVTVDTGRRNGTLRLDIPSAATILDSVGNPLSGLPYTSGETYTIDRDEPSVVSILRADPSPTNAASVTYTVTFSEAMSGVEISDFSLTLSGITGATISEVSGGPTTFTVTVLTGSGEGTLRMDIPVTATITDIAGNSLQDLPYTSGNLYTIDKVAPTVVSILRIDPNPTNATSVHYTVTFSEAVSGVGIGDFSLSTSGTISGASVVSVSGTGATYTVTVSIAAGSGSLRLDIPVTAVITDLVENPLSSLPYVSGESYTILWKVFLPSVMRITP